MDTMNGKSGEKKPGANEELFDVRELVAKDPDLPKRIFEARRANKKQRPGKAPVEKISPQTSNKSSIYIFLTLAVLLILVVVPIVCFIFIRYVLPRGRQEH